MTPDENINPPEGHEAQPDAAGKTSTGNIPNSDRDFADLAINVSVTWEKNPMFILIWLLQSEFKIKAQNFSDLVYQRKTTGSGRKSLTQDLALLDKQIEDHIGFVKHDLMEKYGKAEAPAYYPQFGIVHRGKEYLIPEDHNQRNESLGMLKAALITHGLGGNKYGSAFWNPICEQYNNLMKQALETDSNVSSMVGNKQQMKAELKRALNALILIIKANYPDTYKNVLREWGFQKEKY